MDTKVAEFAENLGKRIVQLRKEHNFAQEKLATLAHMNKGYLSSVESGQRVPSVGMLAMLAKVLQVEVFDLFVFPDGGPLDLLWEEVRLGGSPAAAELRRQFGLPPGPEAVTLRPGPAQRAGRSVKTIAQTKKKAARTHVKASSKGRATTPAKGQGRQATSRAAARGAKRKSR